MRNLKLSSKTHYRVHLQRQHVNTDGPCNARTNISHHLDSSFFRSRMCRFPYSVYVSVSPLKCIWKIGIRAKQKMICTKSHQLMEKRRRPTRKCKDEIKWIATRMNEREGKKWKTWNCFQFFFFRCFICLISGVSTSKKQNKKRDTVKFR